MPDESSGGAPVMKLRPFGRGPADRSRINVENARELRWWSKFLNAAPEELRTAVEQVGPSVDAVVKHLGIQGNAEAPENDTLYTTGPH